MVRTKPRPKMPPGNFGQSSFSRACRKRALIRVDLETSSRVTSRSSRSRLRRSPNVPLAMQSKPSSHNLSPHRPKRRKTVQLVATKQERVYSDTEPNGQHDC